MKTVYNEPLRGLEQLKLQHRLLPGPYRLLKHDSECCSLHVMRLTLGELRR